jgi:hypothetical protein
MESIINKSTYNVVRGNNSTKECKHEIQTVIENWKVHVTHVPKEKKLRRYPSDMNVELVE